VNVKNDDEKCFAWSVLSALYPSNNHRQNNTYNYAKYMGVLNLLGLSFSMKTRDIPRFEKQNPFISVNVLYYDVENREIFVEYLSPHKDREKDVNLLLLQGEWNKFHYVNITSMSRLVSDRTKHHGATYVCNACMHPFTTRQAHDNYLEYCLKHPAQMTIYPNAEDEDECT